MNGDQAEEDTMRRFISDMKDTSLSDVAELCAVLISLAIFVHACTIAVEVANSIVVWP
jgi:hypothetical protein